MSEATGEQTQDVPPFRYTAELANEIERRWQDRWEQEGTYHAPNPVGDLAAGEVPKDKLFVRVVFSYPAGKCLRVGPPRGYEGSDMLARFQRMRGSNVRHALGFDAFGLPAEQCAVQTGTDPRVTTEQNIAIMKRQL